MITNICAGDWLQFQHIEQGRLVTEQGNVMADPKFPDWLWVGDRIVADSDGEQSPDIIVLAHVSGDATDLFYSNSLTAFIESDGSVCIPKHMVRGSGAHQFAAEEAWQLLLSVVQAVADMAWIGAEA